jgi:hypothetical protein
MTNYFLKKVVSSTIFVLASVVNVYNISKLPQTIF